MAFFIEHKGTRTGRTLIQRQNILSQSPAAPPRKTVQTHPFRTGLFRLTGRESHRRHNLFARMDMDFLVNVPDVNRDRVRTDTKLGSDLFIAETADNPLQNAALTQRKQLNGTQNIAPSRIGLSMSLSRLTLLYAFAKTSLHHGLTSCVISVIEARKIRCPTSSGTNPLATAAFHFHSLSAVRAQPRAAPCFSVVLAYARGILNR